jgi:hypothetical protein
VCSAANTSERRREHSHSVEAAGEKITAMHKDVRGRRFSQGEEDVLHIMAYMKGVADVLPGQHVAVTLLDTPGPNEAGEEGLRHQVFSLPVPSCEISQLAGSHFSVDQDPASSGSMKCPALPYFNCSMSISACHLLFQFFSPSSCWSTLQCREVVPLRPHSSSYRKGRGSIAHFHFLAAGVCDSPSMAMPCCGCSIFMLRLTVPAILPCPWLLSPFKERRESIAFEQFT